MTEARKESKKNALDMEIGTLAGEIVNKASNNIAIRCNRTIGVINIMLQIAFFLCVLGYVLSRSNQ